MFDIIRRYVVFSFQSCSMGCVTDLVLRLLNDAVGPPNPILHIHNDSVNESMVYGLPKINPRE